MPDRRVVLARAAAGIPGGRARKLAGRMRDLVHIHQTANLAERVLLPGDPGRAMRLAQALLERPKMLNHNRGLWGYTGTAPDGLALSIQSTGMGGPSAAIVASELIELGARRLLRVGTCGALDPALELGQVLVVTAAIADDGTSAALRGHAPLTPLPPPGSLTRALLEVAGTEPAARRAAPPVVDGAVVSTDLFYGAEPRMAAWAAAGARAVEMEAAALFAVAAGHGAGAGCALLVSNRLGGAAVDAESDAYITEEALHAAELELGRLALHALMVDSGAATGPGAAS